jgi:hypothetical protein
MLFKYQVLVQELVLRNACPLACACLSPAFTRASWRARSVPPACVAFQLRAMPNVDGWYKWSTCEPWLCFIICASRLELSFQFERTWERFHSDRCVKLTPRRSRYVPSYLWLVCMRSSYASLHAVAWSRGRDRSCVSCAIARNRELRLSLQWRSQ